MMLSWKEFNVSISAVITALVSVCPLVQSNQACVDGLILYFSEEPSDEQKAAIQSYWDALTVESPEATGYHSQASIKDKEAELRADAATKAWDALSVCQKKLALNVPVTVAEIFA